MTLALLAVTGLVTFALRASFVLSAGRVELPAPARRVLLHARPAVLAALLVSLVTGSGAVGPDPEAMVVCIVALVASRRLGMVGTVVTGLLTIVVASLL